MIVSKTPLRISFFGGGTDLPSFWDIEEGRVLSAAIDKYVYVIVKKRCDDQICLHYSEKETVSSVDGIEHPLIREAMRLTEVERGIDLVILADIPSYGSGLGSSSSLTVGLLKALYAYQGRSVTAGVLAEQACHIEINVLGKPIGKQDQYIAAYGGLCTIDFLPDGRVVPDRVPCTAATRRNLRNYLLLFSMGVGRKAEDILAEQNSRARENRDLLRQMRDQVAIARAALVSGEIERLGALMNEGWTLKRRLASKISNPAIEQMVAKALAAGAAGAKVTGAGGGGFLLAFCPPTLHQAVRASLPELVEYDFQIVDDGSRVVLGA